MKIRITEGFGWYKGEVGEVFEVTGRNDKYNAYFVRVWDHDWGQWTSSTYWVRDGNYEIIEDDDTKAPEPKSIADIIANLSRRVVQLEGEINTLHRNQKRVVEDLTNRIDMYEKDIVTLDGRTQVINAITKYYEGRDE
jgi:hypothetical protein